MDDPEIYIKIDEKLREIEKNPNETLMQQKTRLLEKLEKERSRRWYMEREREILEGDEKTDPLTGEKTGKEGYLAKGQKRVANEERRLKVLRQQKIAQENEQKLLTEIESFLDTSDTNSFDIN